MYSYRSRHFLVAAALWLAACAEDPSTGLDQGAADLALVVPTGLRDRLVVRNISTASEEAGPARTEDQGYGTYPSNLEGPIYVYASIWNQQTRANFLPGQLSVIGSHNYSGNKGQIETVGHLVYQGTELASQRSVAESSYPFLVDFGRQHFIWTEARIYTDTDCGLSGWGDSAHRAWWEAVMGGPVFEFHDVTRTSYSDRAYQGDCAAAPPPTTTSGGGGEVTCYIWIEYDLYTGEIYDQQLLFCTDGG